MSTELHHFSDIWHGGFPLVPVTEGKNPEPGTGHGFRTASSLGGVTGTLPGLAWHFEPGLPPGFEVQTLHLLCCGYRLTSSAGEHVTLLQTRPGVFVGEAPSRVVPELFSTNRTVRDEESRSWLESGSTRLLLEHRAQGANRRMVLVAGVGTDPDALRMTARKILDETSAPELWNRLWKERMSWLARLGAEERPVMFDLALETLHAAVEPAAGPFASTWIRDPAEAGMNLNHLPGILPALASLEPEVARGVMQTLAELPVLSSGALPAFVPLVGSPGPAPAWPVLSQALALALRTGGLPPPPDALLEKLRAHIEAMSGTGESGPPRWPVEEGAFIPEVWDEGVDPVDLPAMLVAEMEAYREISGDAGRFRERREQLKSHLLTEHWSSGANVFLDRIQGGNLAKRATVGGILPLLWTDLPEPQRQGLHKTLRQEGGLRGDGGLRQWEPRDDDPEEPPVCTEAQHLLLQTLLRQSPQDLSQLMGVAWAKRLDGLSQKDLGFPPRLDETEKAGWHPLTAAFSIRFAPLRNKADLELSRYPRWVRFLEHHRKAIVAIAAAFAVAMPTLLGIHYLFREDYSLLQEQDQAGHAGTLQTLGLHTEAEAILTGLLTRGRVESRHARYHFSRGKSRFQLGNLQGALEDFSAAAQLDGDFLLPAAHWNLAQLQWRMNQTEAAAETFHDILEIFSEGYPDLGRRAETALELLEGGHRFPTP